MSRVNWKICSLMVGKRKVVSADSGAYRLTFLLVCRTNENAVSYFLLLASITRAVMANTNYFSTAVRLLDVLTV